MYDQNLVSVSATETKIKFRYRYRSLNFCYLNQNYLHILFLIFFFMPLWVSWMEICLSICYVYFFVLRLLLSIFCLLVCLLLSFIVILFILSVQVFLLISLDSRLSILAGLSSMSQFFIFFSCSSSLVLDCLSYLTLSFSHFIVFFPPTFYQFFLSLCNMYVFPYFCIISPRFFAL